MTIRSTFAAVTLAIALSACSPKLDAITPGDGFPRQLLAVQGTTLWASVVWDVGLPTEQVMYNGVFGTTYFQIPTNATPGDHPVAIRNSNGTSASMMVSVLPPEDYRDDPTRTTPYFPRPRIEDVAVLFATANGTMFDMGITVSAANLDINATVTIEETVGEGPPTAKAVDDTVIWGALPIDDLQRLNHKPSTFGYPVYHYAQLVNVVKSVTPGATLTITVTNTDGKPATETFTVPPSLAELDSDADGLRDSWEQTGYTAASGNKVPLDQMGVNPLRKDILVEVDSIAASTPNEMMWKNAHDVFANAPVLNPDGSRGVNLVIDYGQGAPFTGGNMLPHHDCLTFDAGPFAATADCPTTASFFAIKSTNFDPDRKLLFHYAIVGGAHANGVDSGEGERHGNDFFIVPLGNLFPLWGMINVQLGTFVHELGHNLGFSHGDLKSDDQNFPFKPNLPSVMNYKNTWFGVDVTCDLASDRLYSYSQGTLRQLNEATMDEKDGVCDDVPADLNMDGDKTDTAPININAGDPMDTGANELWDDFDQWGNLRLNFTKDSNWNNN